LEHLLKTVPRISRQQALIGLRLTRQSSPLRPRKKSRALIDKGKRCHHSLEKLDGTPLTKQDAIKMIGNACPVNTVRELVKAVIQARKENFGIRKEKL
jgi:hypothetical protein